MDLSPANEERMLGLHDVLMICAILCFLLLLSHNILISTFYHIFNMQSYLFVIMAMAFLLALSAATWLANIRGRSTVSASQVALDGLICLLVLLVYGFSSAALSVSR